MAMPDADVDAVRRVLQRLAGGGIVGREEAQRALEGFERLSPTLVPEGRGNAWCRCGHEHDTWTATGLPVNECQWLFCTCPGFGPRPPPGAEEKERLGRETALARAAWSAKQEAGR